jgi:hypothetical protein
MMVQRLRQHVPDYYADLVLNLDKGGMSQREERVVRIVIIPVSMSDRTMHDVHVSDMVCVLANVESLTGLMVASQVNDSAIGRLKPQAWRMGVDLILEHGQKLYMSAILFRQYSTTMLLPFIIQLLAND